MIGILSTGRRGIIYRPNSSEFATLSGLALAVLVVTASWTPAYGTDIQGTMSNFDVFNETGVDVYGAEIELEGCHAASVNRTYPPHFNTMLKTEYTHGTAFGTLITFKGYNFDPRGYMIPRTGQTTNGHYCVNLPGCEHFGFAVTTQPTTTRFYWLNGNYQRIGTNPMSIPNATWTYVPPAPPLPGIMQAVVVPPPPEIPDPMLPDSIWMKTYVTEIDHPFALDELISAPPGAPDSVAPQLPSEIEFEWVLLEGAVPEQGDWQVGANAIAVLRRYEYYRYTGAYDPSDHAPLSQGLDPTGNPYANELGQFIAANMVAANLACPVMGDINGDGIADGRDVSLFINCLITGTGGCACADVNGGGIDLTDVPVFVHALLG